MEVTAILNLSGTAKEELAQILGCDAVGLDQALAAYASAALHEHVSMFLGQKVFTRGSDLLEYRLLLLIEHAFDGRIPDEQDVCKLFQVSASAARSLIRAVMSKYQYQLKGAIEKSARLLLDSAEHDQASACMTVSVHNLNLVDELNRELADVDTSLPPVQKKRGSVSTYDIQLSSYARLCARFGIQPKVPLQ
jgi:hypothetical protein